MSTGFLATTNSAVSQEVSGRTLVDLTGRGPSSGTEILDIGLVTVRRHYGWLIPAMVMMALLTGAIIWWLSEPRFKATHWIEVSKKRVLDASSIKRSGNLVSSESPIILSDIIVAPVIARPDIQSLPSMKVPSERARNLRDNLRLQAGGTPDRLQLSFTDVDAKSSEVICNAIADEYMSYRREYEQQQGESILRSLRPELAKWEDLVQERKQNVENLTLAAISAGDVSDQRTDGRFEFITELRKRINDLMIEQVGIEAKLKRINADWPANRSLIDEQVKQDPEVRDLEALISSYRGLIRDMKTSGMDSIKKETIQEIQQKIASASQDVELAEANAGQALLDKWASSEQENLERQLYISRFELELLESVFEEEKNRFLAAGDQALKLRFAEDDLSSAQSLLDGLRQRSTAIEMESRYAAPVISLRRAEVPEHPEEAIYLTKNNAFFLLAFIAIPFGLALGLEFKLNRFTQVNTIARKVNLDVLGEIASISESAEREAIQKADQHLKYRSYTYSGDIHRQSVDNLCVRLTLDQPTKTGIVTAILSSFEGEAKTTLSKDVAKCLSESGLNRVLLIDMDLRCPDQHRIWEISNQKGVCESARSEIHFEDAVHSVSDSFDVMPAGKNKGMHLSGVLSSRIGDLFAWAREHYDHVIVDTAPLNHASESLVIAKHSDACMLSLLRDVSRLEPTTQTVSHLRDLGVPLAGCVLSGITPLQYQYRYGNYYYYRGTYYSKNASVLDSEDGVEYCVDLNGNGAGTSQ